MKTETRDQQEEKLSRQEEARVSREEDASAVAQESAEANKSKEEARLATEKENAEKPVKEWRLGLEGMHLSPEYWSAVVALATLTGAKSAAEIREVANTILAHNK